MSARAARSAALSPCRVAMSARCVSSAHLARPVDQRERLVGPPRRLVELAGLRGRSSPAARGGSYSLGRSLADFSSAGTSSSGRPRIHVDLGALPVVGHRRHRRRRLRRGVVEQRALLLGDGRRVRLACRARSSTSRRFAIASDRSSTESGASGSATSFCQRAAAAARSFAMRAGLAAASFCSSASVAHAVAWQRKSVALAALPVSSSDFSAISRQPARSPRLCRVPISDTSASGRRGQSAGAAASAAASSCSAVARSLAASARSAPSRCASAPAAPPACARAPGLEERVELGHARRADEPREHGLVGADHVERRPRRRRELRDRRRR